MSAKGNTLTNWTWLNVNDYLVSNNGSYFAIMQGDGNFVVYHGSGPSDNQGVVWDSAHQMGYDTYGGDYFAILQNDKNFVIYRGTGPSDNRGVVWDTAHTHDRYATVNGTQCTAVLGDDGTFCINQVGGGTLWSTSWHENPGPGPSILSQIHGAPPADGGSDGTDDC
jgi:hypothetical protein